MAAIFWLSGTPGETLARGASPLIARAPRIVTHPIGKKPTKLSWLKAGHFAGYAALGAALLYGFHGAARRPGLWATATAALYAASDEIHQVFVPGRHAGWEDVALDITAAGLAILLLALARVAIKKGLSKKSVWTAPGQ